MNKRVFTTDGVAWDVQRTRPAIRSKSASDDVTVEQKDHVGFEALFMIMLSAIFIITVPIIVQSDRWWLALLVLPLVGVTWFMYLANWHVVMVREGEVVHRTRVRGRRPAAKLLNELADEISRTPDEKLHG